MSDALFEMSDFYPPPAAQVFPPEMLCSVHQRHRDEKAHGIECWGGKCPACGDPVVSAFDVNSNHSGAERGFCCSMGHRLNHLTYDIRYGKKPDARDLTVLDLGWRIAPDGSQIPPLGAPQPHGWHVTWSTKEEFARWVGRS